MTHWLTKEEGPEDFILHAWHDAQDLRGSGEPPSVEDVLQVATESYPVDRETAEEALANLRRDGFLAVVSFEGRYDYLERVGYA